MRNRTAFTAMKNALTLITLNRKHYEMIEGPPAEGAELLAAKLLRIMLPCPRPRQTERIPDVPGTRGATMQG